MNNDWEFDYRDSYQSPYTQRPPEVDVKPKKSGKLKRVMAGLLTLVLCGAMGVGGGFIGSTIANKNKTVIYKAPAEATQSQNDTAATGDALKSGEALTVSQIAATAGPSVVEVMTEGVQTDPFFGQRILSGAGSGVIISEDGYIITNQHVVDGTNKLTVTLSDKSKHDAKLIGADSKTDIAVIKIDAQGLTAAVLGDSDNLTVGEFALAIGNPMGTLGGTVTDGIISALNRDIVVGTQTMTLLQTNAAVSPGNSGGGLFNEKGELVGIVNSKSSQANTEGLGFAIPINTAFKVATELMDNGYVSGRPALGIKILNVTDLQTAMQAGVDNLGVYITEITKGGGAEKADLRKGDRFISVDGAAVGSLNDITDAIGKRAVGDKVEVQVARDGRIVTATVTLGEMQHE